MAVKKSVNAYGVEERMELKTSQMEAISGDDAAKHRVAVCCSPYPMLMVTLKEYQSCLSPTSRGDSSKETPHSLISCVNISLEGLSMEVLAPFVLVGGQAR